MITVRTSPAYVNRVRQDWTANGGVYGDGGVYALVPSNDPFAQLGPTLDLTFAGNPTDLLTASTTAGYTLDTYFTPETYQIAVPYAVWGANGLEQKNFADIVTFTRASTGTYFNSAGTLTSAAINEARFDYNPSTLAAQGLLIEESRTNSIRNNTMVGAVAGTPGTLPTNWTTFTSLTGLTREVVGTGSENGIAYLDIRLSGTPSAAGSYSIFQEATIATIAAVSGQTWAFTQYSKLTSGSTSGITSIQNSIIEYSAASAFLTQGSTSFTPTSASLATQRYGHTRTLTNASTAFIRSAIQLNLDGTAIDITLRIGLPQLELGAFATSVIPTTVAQVTREKDVASVNTLSPWYNATEGTLYLNFTPVGLKSTSGQGVLRIDDNTESNRISFGATSTNAMINSTIVSGSTSGSNATPSTTYVANNTYKIAFAVKLDDVQSFSGGSAGTIDTTALIPSGLAVLRFAANTTDVIGNAWFRRFTYYPRRLSQAEGIAITA